jgi:hypothetical protein
MSSLKLSLISATLAQRVRPTLIILVGQAFGERARAHIMPLARTGVLPFLPERVGNWKDPGVEIDVMDASETERLTMLGEYKWASRPVVMNTWRDLKVNAR